MPTESCPVRIEDNKENELNTTANLFDGGSGRRDSFEFSFEMSQQATPTRSQLEKQTRNLFTGTINVAPIEKTANIEPAKVAPSPVADDTLNLLPPITPEPKKKRRSLLETIQRNNLIRQNSPQVAKATKIDNPQPNLNDTGIRKKKYLQGLFSGDTSSSDENEPETNDSDVIMEKENKTIHEPTSNDRVNFNNTISSPGGDKTMVMDQTVVMEKTMVMDQTVAMEKSMVVEETASAQSIAKLIERSTRLVVSSDQPMPKPATATVPKLDHELEPNPEYRSPLQITDKEIHAMNANLRKLQEDEPRTPSTPNRKKTKLREKLMRTRESIGLTRHKMLNSPIVRTPTTRSQIKHDRENNSPVTRSASRKNPNLLNSNSNSSVPLKATLQFEDSPLKPPVTPKTPKVAAVVPAVNNTSPVMSNRKTVRENSITNFNLNPTEMTDIIGDYGGRLLIIFYSNNFV